MKVVKLLYYIYRVWFAYCVIFIVLTLAKITITFYLILKCGLIVLATVHHSH